VAAKRARWNTVAACGHWVMAGARIISRGNGKTWLCMDCALATRPGLPSAA
jgi:hypothetical protein